MKKEKVLLYIISNKIYIYSLKKKKEIIKEVDTSLFFENGEIKEVKEFLRIIKTILSSQGLISSIVKADIDVLYNNVTSCDLKALYKLALSQLEFNNISFTTIESIINTLSEPTKIIYYDGLVYTSFSENKKSKNLDIYSKDTVIVGNTNNKYIYYSKKDLIWEIYKRSFTKDK